MFVEQTDKPGKLKDGNAEKENCVEKNAWHQCNTNVTCFRPNQFNLAKHQLLCFLFFSWKLCELA